MIGIILKVIYPRDLVFYSLQYNPKLFLCYTQETCSQHDLLNEKLHLTPIACGKPFDVACASYIKEKSYAISPALRNLTHTFNRIRYIKRKIILSGPTLSQDNDLSGSWSSTAWSFVLWSLF